MTALCSAFLDNVTTILLMAPVSILLAKQLRLDPFPVSYTHLDVYKRQVEKVGDTIIEKASKKAVTSQDIKDKLMETGDSLSLIHI